MVWDFLMIIVTFLLPDFPFTQNSIGLDQNRMANTVKDRLVVEQRMECLG